METNNENLENTKNHELVKVSFDDKWDDLCLEEKKDLHTQLTHYAKTIEILLKQMVTIYGLTGREAVEHMGETMVIDAQAM